MDPRAANYGMPTPTLNHEMMVANMKEFFEQYNNTSDSCFNQCVSNFNKRSLSLSENICIRSCGLKFLKATQRNQVEFQNLYPKFVERQGLKMQEEAEAKKKEEEAAAFAEFAKREMAKAEESKSQS